MSESSDDIVASEATTKCDGVGARQRVIPTDLFGEANLNRIALVVNRAPAIAPLKYLCPMLRHDQSLYAVQRPGFAAR